MKFKEMNLPRTQDDMEILINAGIVSSLEEAATFFAQAVKNELDLMRKFSNLKTVLVNHGDADVKKIFAKKITEEISPKHVAILGPNHTMRVGAYGLLKSYPFNP